MKIHGRFYHLHTGSIIQCQNQFQSITYNIINTKFNIIQNKDLISCCKKKRMLPVCKYFNYYYHFPSRTLLVLGFVYCWLVTEGGFRTMRLTIFFLILLFGWGFCTYIFLRAVISFYLKKYDNVINIYVHYLVGGCFVCCFIQLIFGIEFPSLLSILLHSLYIIHYFWISYLVSLKALI